METEKVKDVVPATLEQVRAAEWFEKFMGDWTDEEIECAISFGYLRWWIKDELVCVYHVRELGAVRRYVRDRDAL